MAVKTAAEWVDIYDEAILKIVSGTVSSYSVSGRTFTKHDLQMLHDIREYWAARAAEHNTGFTTSSDMSR